MTTTQSHTLSRLLTIAAMVICANLLVSNKAYAYGNDYLEQKDHYSVYVKGVDALHFKVPVYSRGTYNYFVGSIDGEISEFYYLDKSGSAYTIFEINADRYGNNNDDNITYGTVSVKAKSGIVEVTNIYNGTRAVVPQDDKKHSYDVTKTKEVENDKDYVTWLEIDWYPPSSLDDQPFSVHAIIKICQSSANSVYYRKKWDFGDFKGANLMTDPQLYEPVFYTSKEASLSGYGCAAVPYVVYHDLTDYHTSFNPNIYKTDKRADNIYVPTTDTLQPGFKAFFNVYRHKTPSVEMIEQTTNAVTIPAYHRIYDFAVTEEKDSTDTYTGNNVLRWQVKNPNLPDLVEGDYFEIQRALSSDFSDAQTIDVVPMERGIDKSNYVFVDESRESWTGHVATEYETVDANVEYLAKNCPILAANGDTMCHMDIKASSDKLRLPSVPVYYRIRRASASMWGWKGHDFARDAGCLKRSYLAPLASTQPDYTLNTETRQVDFRIQIENANTDIGMPAAEDVKLDYTVNDVDSVDLTIVGHYYSSSMPTGFVRITPEQGEVQKFAIQDWIRSFRVPYGTVVEVGTRYSSYNENVGAAFTLTKPAATITTSIDHYNNWTATISERATSDAVEARFAEVRTQIVDSLRPLLQAKAITGLGRCMWDKSARLVLIKFMDGVKQEFVIPQDSIRRLPNGNWQAHYVDVADHACTNYSYAVRIDQSASDLHVSDSAYLQPVAVSGPNLYFDEGASIKTFTASEEDANGEMKRGILLQWEPTNAAVDRYVLRRREYVGGTQDTTVYEGADNSFFDTGVRPRAAYRYTIYADYDCNGRHTAHEASEIGARSEFGEIRGRVLMPDNSGMPGVTVTLTNSGNYPTKTCVTGADGAYVFDSVQYEFYTGSGTDYTITPTAKYGTFSFNYTSAATATVHLSEDNCIARDIEFMNTATVRLSGRALYKGSTIPVAGAMFLLSGDTVLRNGAPLTTGIDGNFELTLTQGQPYTLQICKTGHTFDGDGILRVEDGSETFALDKSLDGVRFYDQTKVRLVGRVAGGNTQRDLPEAFGLGTNNLGDNLQLVLQLEGDNTAQFVHDPNDLTRDTIQHTFDHVVYMTDPLSAVPSRTVGSTSMVMAKKRITIRPDQTTGEFAVDLFPVKYKVVQASANGYATLFAAGQGSETFDLTNAPLVTFDPKRGKDSVHYNAVYDRIYHAPVQIHMQQLLYGLPQDGYGEASMKVSSFNIQSNEQVALYTKGNDGTVTYTLGYPVFYHNRKYQFEAQAYEDYYYNNDREAGALDRVPQRGGTITIHNGMQSATSHVSYQLDSLGKNRNIYLDVTRIETELAGEASLHTVSTALTVEGNTVETEAFRSFVAGDVVLANELRSTDAAITVLDIIRDPGGNGSSAWVESGASYTYSFSESYDFNFGVELTPTWGVSVNSEIGTITSTPGTYTGTSMSTSKEFAFSIPVTHEIAWSKQYTYNFTTSDKITTSPVKSKQGIGANADVFLGVKTSVLAGKAKSVSVINETMYQQRQPAIQAGAMHVLAQGVDGNGKRYYLVIGEKIVFGSQIDNTFAYTQHHILNSILPRIFIERDNLLEYFSSESAAQQAANQRGEEVYWYIDSLTAVQLQQPLLADKYKMIVPTNSTAVFTDRVGAMENTIKHWIAVLSKNEEEKVKARYSGQLVGVYSVSAGSSYNHTDSYTSTFNYSHKPQTMAFGANTAANAGKFAESWTKNVLSAAMRGGLGKASERLIQSATKFLQGLSGKDGSVKDGAGVITEIESKSAGSSFKMIIEPVIDIDMNFREGQEITNKKSAGFTIMPDKQGELTVLDNLGEITVAVYRANVDSVWESQSEPVISGITTNVPESDKYGSYVFFTQSGSTYCMYEDEDTTQIYNPGTVLSNPTIMLAKPDMSINTYEQTNVLPDQKAKFKLELRNVGEMPYGWYDGGVYFTLSLYNNSNPNGAKVYVNGVAIAQGIEYYLAPGQSIVQTLEVERGDVDDYDNLQLCFQVSDCPKNWTFLDLSVHFIPLSSDVQIDMPRQNWVMNTLSQHDSTGYYIPVEISGFDTHYKNFDHIDFQYKLSTESDDMWVTACSFFAEDSLYERATGNKAMIENGRILPFRFYGERDPIEQQYDLRAVSFCRYGSGFVSKASTVISGTKDTRAPRVFGAAQPADAILGVGTDLKLRFNEAIAGNYLDEDNNFQITGMTNATGITTGTSLHFNEEESSNAYTQVSRSLTNSSFTLDMLVRPSQAQGGSLFKTLSQDELYAVSLSYTPNGQLLLLLSGSEQGGTFATAPGVLPAGIFSRVVAVYDNEQKTARFYIGTQQVALSQDYDTKLPEDFVLRGTGTFRFGIDGASDMLEARVWLKALTQEEVAATNMKYLTGYECDLLAYYRMNEGQGETIKDYANGATLYLNNTAWNLKKGISLAIKSDERVVLNGNLLSRSAIQDESILLWFRTTTPDGTLFSAGEQKWSVPEGYADGAWHHWVLTVDRTRNNVSLFIDSEMKQSFSATDFGAISGAMYLGGDGFEGNNDDLVFFEQALPKTLIQEFGNNSPTGDEMGIFGYLPFEQQVLNPNGVLELVFSPNDQRVFRDPNGNVVDKVIPLITRVEGAASAEAMADKINHAPTRDQGLLTKMMFDWAFNNDELLINLNMDDREINKQTVYITVRDVEDLNGNPMVSPVSWVAFVDRNALKWSQRTLRVTSDYDDPEDFYALVDIINQSGRRHQYTIESLPDWLTVSESYGSMNALEEKQLRLSFNANLPVGVYNDQIYLTDEDGLVEPLIIEYTVSANPPYDVIDKNKYPLNMSVCGHVMIMKSGEYNYDTDERDIVYAMYKDECIGMANISFDEASNKSKLYLTVYGSELTSRQTIRFQLWQASTGKFYDLSADRDILFAHGAVYGCGDGNPVVFTTNGNERQTVNLNAGWNWTSFNLDLRQYVAKIEKIMTANQPWSEGDLIKNPATRHFVIYSDSLKRFVGDFDYLRYIYTYMIYSRGGNTIHISGNNLPADSMYVPVRGDGQWSPMPCLLKQVTPVAEALADYYDYATPGDMLKSHERFAYFSEDKKWEGDLTAIRPGEGYLFRRQAPGEVNIRFYNRSNANAQRQKTAGAQRQKTKDESGFSNPAAATNMTMIARVENEEMRKCENEQIRVYVGGELAAVATPIDSLYFLTIQSNRVGELRFEINGETYVPESGAINNLADSHYGSPKAPIILRPADSDRPYKIIENDHVVIIRGGERYDVTGKKL